MARVCVFQDVAEFRWGGESGSSQGLPSFSSPLGKCTPQPHQLYSAVSTCICLNSMFTVANMIMKVFFLALVQSFIYDFTFFFCIKLGVHLTVCSSRLEDSSEQVKKELAGIIGQLSCIQSELSKLSDTRTESTHRPEILCHQLNLATEHAGKTFPSLRATFIKPFLPLLRQQAPSSVKQGFFLSVFFQNEL